jgi:hypothetical protein
MVLYSKASRPALGPIQPPVQWVSGAPSPGIKWPRHETDHSHPSSAEVKNAGVIPPTSVVSNQLPVNLWRNIHFPLPYFHSLLRCWTNWFRYLLLLEARPEPGRNDRILIASTIEYDSQGIDINVTNPKKTRQFKFSVYEMINLQQCKDAI